MSEMSLNDITSQLMEGNEGLFVRATETAPDADLASGDRIDRDSIIPRQTGVSSENRNYLDQVWNWMKGVAGVHEWALLHYPQHSTVYLNQYVYRRTADPSDSTSMSVAGDIVINPEWDKGVAPFWYIWPDGKAIPYVFVSADPCVKAIVREATLRYEEATNGCIRFSEQTTKSDDAIQIITSLDGCFASLGFKKLGNVMNLSRGCKNVGTVMHLLGHTLGLAHEDQRPDARDFVKVNPDNIDVYGMSSSSEVDPVTTLKYKLVFEPLHGTRTKWEDEIKKVPYEYGSIMHNSKFVYGVDISKDKTLIGTKGPQFDDLFGNRGFVTETDARVLNEMYSCQRLPIKVADRMLKKALAPGNTYASLEACVAQDSQGMRGEEEDIFSP